MAIFLTGVGANSFLVKYNGVDLTDHVRQVVISENVDKIEITAMGAVSKAYVPGLRDDMVTIDFFQDYASAKVDATLYPFLGSTSGATLLIQTSGATVSATQPSYSMVACLYTYDPINGQVGQVSTTSVAFAPAAGSSITRGTS